MKRIIVVLIALSVFSAAFSFYAATALTKEEAGIVYSLANRKSYRLGLRGSVLSPTKDILVSKDSSFDFGLEFDAKLNENLDTGPRFGVSTFKNNQGATLNATYTIMRFGFGGRIYALYWGEYGSTHGFANLYFAAEANYYIANKSDAVVAASPSSFAGVGGQVGTGIEFAFGPNTGAFVEANVLRTNVKDSSGNTLPLDGYTLAAGTRLAFF